MFIVDWSAKVYSVTKCCIFHNYFHIEILIDIVAFYPFCFTKYKINQIIHTINSFANVISTSSNFQSTIPPCFQTLNMILQHCILCYKKNKTKQKLDIDPYTFSSLYQIFGYRWVVGRLIINVLETGELRLRKYLILLYLI